MHTTQPFRVIGQAARESEQQTHVGYLTFLARGLGHQAEYLGSRQRSEAGEAVQRSEIDGLDEIP